MTITCSLKLVSGTGMVWTRSLAALLVEVSSSQVDSVLAY